MLRFLFWRVIIQFKFFLYILGTLFDKFDIFLFENPESVLIHKKNTYSRKRKKSFHYEHERFSKNRLFESSNMSSFSVLSSQDAKRRVFGKEYTREKGTQICLHAGDWNSIFGRD